MSLAERKGMSEKFRAAAIGKRVETQSLLVHAGQRKIESRSGAGKICSLSFSKKRAKITFSGHGALAEMHKEQPACRICGKQEGRYSCPRCSLLYCSLACYKDNGHVRCTESFYKRQVEQEMQGTALATDRKKMLDILKNRFDAEQDGNANECCWWDRFEDVENVEELSVAELEALLGEAGMQEFYESANVEPWTPWWQGPDIHYTLPHEHMPVHPKDRTVSDFCWSHLLELLGVYTRVMRMFNGEASELAEEATEEVMRQCVTLNSTHVFQGAHEALPSFDEQCLKDTSQVLSSPTSVLRALLDMHRLTRHPKLPFYIAWINRERLQSVDFLQGILDFLGNLCLATHRP